MNFFSFPNSCLNYKMEQEKFSCETTRGGTYRPRRSQSSCIGGKGGNGPGTPDSGTPVPSLPSLVDKQTENITFPRTLYAGGRNLFSTRKSSCVNARGIPLAVQQVLGLWGGGGGGGGRIGTLGYPIIPS